MSNSFNLAVSLTFCHPQISWEDTVSGNPIHAYYGAKTWAEKAAWDFLKEEKPKFELVTICPPMVNHVTICARVPVY
jgi:hypothetical protein